MADGPDLTGREPGRDIRDGGLFGAGSAAAHELWKGVRVARHNREGTGRDQHGFEYRVSYQPDWLRHVKISRKLSSGRQSTMTLFRNPMRCATGRPGRLVRTRILCAEQGLDVEITVDGDQDGVCRVCVTCEVPSVAGVGTEEVTFTMEDGLPAAKGSGFRGAARGRGRGPGHG
jgi:hypothetical protein